MNNGDLPGEIYDYLVAHPEGATIKDFVAATEARPDEVRKAIRSARLILADGDTLWITADPQGAREQWLYRLVDGSFVPDAEKTRWAANRVKDTTTRVSLLSKSMEVACAATDGRSPIGRKARILDKQLRRLVEDLEEVDV